LSYFLQFNTVFCFWRLLPDYFICLDFFKVEAIGRDLRVFPCLLEYSVMEMENEKIKKDYFLPLSILLAAILIGGSVVYSAGKKASNPANPSAAGSGSNALLEKPDVSQVVWQGDPLAPVSVVEYSDFQCPICGNFFSDVLPSLKRDYIDTGKVRFAYLDFVFLGPESLVAAQSVNCASDQGKFWQFHDLVHQAEIADGTENNNNLTIAFLSGLAKQINIDSIAFGKCLSGEKYKNKVLQATSQGQKAGVRATPTFFINDQKLEGLDPNDPYGKIKLIIDSELKKVGR